VLRISLYVYTNVIGALLIPEPLTNSAQSYITDCDDLLLISHFTGVEFASLVARRVRTGEFTYNQATLALSQFDAWTEALTQRIEPEIADFAVATSFLRRLDLPLRTLDALHIAIARRFDATLVTFDQRMATSARALGTAVATP